MRTILHSVREFKAVTKAWGGGEELHNNSIDNKNAQGSTYYKNKHTHTHSRYATLTQFTQISTFITQVLWALRK